ncbi:hypothetical protein ACGFKZ_14815, partial [Micromonospora tulbaghiae]|uniref:hypothetical protein n=1 Tax=Micromonospora tulbaghiae TaxID=479978 RepID=UPI00372370D3
MSQGEITTLVTALGDIATVLRNADPADKAEVYRQLGLRLNYQPETQTVRAEVDLSAHRGVIVCVRGGIQTQIHGVHAQHGHSCRNPITTMELSEPGLSRQRCFRRSWLVGFSGWEAVAEGDGEGVQ